MNTDLNTRAKHASGPLRAVIIGGGFAGLAMAITLKKAGIDDFLLLERGADVGGVWRENSYPGAACDIVSRLYSFSFHRNRKWKNEFATRDEIYDYLRSCVVEYELQDNVIFNSEVVKSVYDSENNIWTTRTSSGEVFSSRLLVSSVGQFNNPFIPDIAGLSEFKGAYFHSAQWRHDLPLADKTVAVVGNGASAIQFVPRIAESVKKLILYQRSPQYVLPKSVFAGAGNILKGIQRFPFLRGLARLLIFISYEQRIWQKTLFAGRRLKSEKGFKSYLSGKIKDPALLEKLTPDYPFGCKRILGSDEWYDALQRPNVEVVADGIEKVEQNGIRTVDGKFHDADIIVFGTGFTPTAFLSGIELFGTDGVEIHDAWRDGAEAFLGMSVSGFPNFFMMYGPNSNVGGSVVFVLENQANFILRALRMLESKSADAIDLKPETQSRFNSKIQGRIKQSVWARDDCRTFIKDERGRVTTIWPGSLMEFKRKVRNIKEDDYTFINGSD